MLQMCEQQYVEIKFVLNLRVSPKCATFAYNKSFTKLENQQLWKGIRSVNRYTRKNLTIALHVMPKKAREKGDHWGRNHLDRRQVCKAIISEFHSRHFHCLGKKTPTQTNRNKPSRDEKKKSMQCKELSSLQQESIWGLLYYFNYIQVTTFV